MAAKTKHTAALSKKDIDKWDDHLEKLIDVFKPFLLETLRVSHLLCLIHLQEVKNVAAMIHQKENEGKYKEASSDLLDAIQRSDEPGKWQMFMDALKEVENSTVLETLLDEKPEADLWLDNQANRKLIDLLSHDIEKHLMLEPLLGKMFEKKLILDEDRGKLRALIRAGKSREANAVLLLIMHRCSSSWYCDFLTVLYEFDEHHLELAKLIDPEFCQKKLEKNMSPADVNKQNSAMKQESQGSVTDQRNKSVGNGAPSIEMNLGSNSGGREKTIRDKSLPQAQQPLHAGDKQPTTTAGKPGEATCACKCCSQMLAEVSSLRSELAEMRSLLKSFVANDKQHS